MLYFKVKVKSKTNKGLIMRNMLLFSMLALSIVITTLGADFFSTATVETYRTDLGTTMVSPNLYFKYGCFEGYGFIDRYITEDAFYHGEFQLAYTPFKSFLVDRVAIIAESRWDKYAKDENSVGLRVKLW